jgi:integrase/recombinase XerD
MAGKQAKTLNDRQILKLLLEVDNTRYPERNRVAVLLSVRAGLRAVEIAKIKRRMVLSADGAVGDYISLEDGICKKQHGRHIPMHPQLQQAIRDYFKEIKGVPDMPLLLSERAWRDETYSYEEAEPMRRESISRLFKRLYRKLGFIGCSSHSGRRTFGTRAARKISEAGGSLRDVQDLLGHNDLSSTQRYIDVNHGAKKKVIDLL